MSHCVGSWVCRWHTLMGLACGLSVAKRILFVDNPSANPGRRRHDGHWPECWSVQAECLGWLIPPGFRAGGSGNRRAVPETTRVSARVGSQPTVFTGVPRQHR